MSGLDRAFRRFAPLSRPIAFIGCADLSGTIAARLAGWHVEPYPATPNILTPVITIERRAAEYVLTSDFISGEETYDDAPDIVCAFLAELIMAIGAENPASLFLHAGAVVMEGRLIAFPAKGRTGKSLLTAQLAQAGARVYSDDVLPVDLTTRRGRALGIAPRLRLPLPDRLSTDTRAWIERRQGLANEHMTYIGLERTGPGGLAAFGEEKPIGAFVFLARAEGTVPGLAPCPRADIMKLLIRQHFGAAMPSTEIIAQFKALVESAPCWRLDYTGGEQAVDLLAELARAA